MPGSKPVFQIPRFAQDDMSRRPDPFGVILSGGKAGIVPQTCVAKNLLTPAIKPVPLRRYCDAAG